MRIQIVVGEHGWIIGVLAEQLRESIKKTFNHSASIKLVHGEPQHGDEVYIHFIYLNTKIVKGARNIIYVTHVDYTIKLMIILLQHLRNAEFIVMSNQTGRLIESAIPNSIVHILNPASIHFKKNNDISKQLKIGLFFRIYEDNRKNNKLIAKLLNYASDFKENTKIVIYGKGFGSLINEDNNAIVEYSDSDFNKEKYNELLLSCDYVAYFGMDEGAISILDAATLNIPVIATKQGYHLDIELAKGSILFDDGNGVLDHLCNLIKFNSQKSLDVESQLYQIINTKKEKIEKNHLTFINFFTIPFVKNSFRRGDDFVYFFKILFNKIKKLILNSFHFKMK
jgi:hypothetical protein